MDVQGRNERERVNKRESVLVTHTKTASKVFPLKIFKRNITFVGKQTICEPPNS